MSTREIGVELLTRPASRAFGDAVERDPRTCIQIHNGEVLRHHDFARVDVTAEDGRPVVGLRPGTWHPSPIALHAADFLAAGRSTRGEILDQNYGEESIDDEGIVVTLDTDIR